MVTFHGNSHLDLAFQKVLRYSHHRENYKKSLQNGVIPPGLRIKKQPAFMPTTEDFYIKWDSILYDAERKLVELLLVESEKVVAKIEIGINNQLIEEYSTEASKKREELERRNQQYRRELQQHRRITIIAIIINSTIINIISFIIIIIIIVLIMVSYSSRCYVLLDFWY